MKTLLIIIAFVYSSLSLMGQNHFLGIKQNSLRGNNLNQDDGTFIIARRAIDLELIGGYALKKTLLVGRIGFAVDNVETNQTDIFPQLPGLIFTRQFYSKKNSFHIGLGLEKAYIFKEKIYLAVGFYVPFEFSPSYKDVNEESVTDLGYPYRSSYAEITYDSYFSVKSLLSGRFHYFILPQWSIGVEFNTGITFEKPQPFAVSTLSVYNELDELIQEERSERTDNQYTLRKISNYGIGVQFHFK